MQSYFDDDEISVQEAKNLYKFRTRNANFKENYENSYVRIVCPLCLIQPDTQLRSVKCLEIVAIKGTYSNMRSIFATPLTTRS